MRGKIREGMEKLIKKGGGLYLDDSSFLNSEKLLKEDFEKRPFGNVIDGIEKFSDIKFKEIENIKTKDFMAVLKEIYEEVKEEKEKTVLEAKKIIKECLNGLSEYSKEQIKKKLKKNNAKNNFQETCKKIIKNERGDLLERAILTRFSKLKDDLSKFPDLRVADVIEIIAEIQN